MMKQSYIRSDAEGITEINHIVHSDVSYAGVDNCYYCETDVQYSLGNGKSAMKIIVILVKQDTNVFTIALVPKAEETENVLLKMLDTITWK